MKSCNHLVDNNSAQLLAVLRHNVCSRAHPSRTLMMCVGSETESFCPEEGWVRRAPLPEARMGHCLVALGGKLYR
jgi:hypothetical protein